MFQQSWINLMKCLHCTSSNKVVKNVSETPSESFASNYNFVAAFQPQKTNLQGSISLFSCPGAIKLFSPQLRISSNIVDKTVRGKNTLCIFFLSPLHQVIHTNSNHCMYTQVTPLLLIESFTYASSNSLCCLIVSFHTTYVIVI